MQDLKHSSELRTGIAEGFIEAQAAARAAEKAQFDYVMQEEARNRVLEAGEDIEYLLARGMITAEDARKKRARNKMHEHESQGGQRVETESQRHTRAALAASGFQTTDQILEAALRVRTTNWLAEVLWRGLQLNRLEDYIDWERRKRSHPAYKHMFPRVNNLAKNSPNFEAFMFSVVALNALLISFQLTDEKGESGVLLWMERVIMTIFLVEIIIRVAADGWLWFLDLANTFDFVLIVGTGLLPTFVFQPLLSITTPPVLRVVQILRCVRLVRVLKPLRARLRTLWTLVAGILDSSTTLMWTFVMLVLVLFIFAVILQQTLRKSGWHYDDEQQALVETHFDNVLGGMFTLFQILTLDSWTGVCRPLHRSYIFPLPAFVLFIIVAVMGVNNLVVAVIVNNAFARSDHDQELQSAIKSQEIQNDLDSLHELFDALVGEQSSEHLTPVLTQKDYERGLKRARTNKLWDKLKAMEVERTDIESLWEFCDFPEEIDADEWASKIRSLKGVCKAKDTFAMSMTLKKHSIRINKAARELEIHKKLSFDLLQEAIRVQHEMRSAMMGVQDFTKILTTCIPPGPVAMIKSKDVINFSDEMSRKIADMLHPIMVPEALEDLQNSEALLAPPAEAYTEKKRSPKKQQKAVRAGNRRQPSGARQNSDLATIPAASLQQEPLQLEDVEDADFEPAAAGADDGRRGSKSEGGEQAMVSFSLPGEVQETKEGLRQRSPKGSD